MSSNIASTSVDEIFAHELPKIELHAHLTGSISPRILHDIWQKRKATAESVELEDPLQVMSTDLGHFNVATFFPLFDTYVYKLIDDIWSVKFSTRAVLQAFLDDGTRYLELRTTPRALPSGAVSKDQYVEAVLGTIDEFMEDTAGLLSVYLILSVDRRQSASEAQDTVDLAVKLSNSGRRVVGIDLCGNPAKGNVSVFRDAFAAARASGLHLTLHFAEVEASSTEEELHTLLSFKPDRLGHVIHVPPQFKREIINKRLGLELCLSCNVLAGLTLGGFASHHFGDWRNSGCPIALCTDDVGVFGSPLSNEYFVAAQNFNLSQADCMNLGRAASSMIFGGAEEKDRLRDLLQEFEQSKLAPTTEL